MLGWLRLFARSRVERTLLLDPDEFDAMLARERCRADCAGSQFSVLTLSMPTTQLQPTDFQTIAEVFQQRRRATDLTGRMHDGRIGVVLPDTTREQAEVLATSLREALAVKGITFSYAIAVYPENYR